MTSDIIRQKTRKEFCEYLVQNCVLREIEEYFDSADIDCSDDRILISGQRRELVERYYISLDFQKSNDVQESSVCILHGFSLQTGLTWATVLVG